MSTPGTRLVIATICSNELAHKLTHLQQRFRLLDGECASVLAGLLITLCRRNRIDPHELLQQALDSAQEKPKG